MLTEANQIELLLIKMRAEMLSAEIKCNLMVAANSAAYLKNQEPVYGEEMFGQLLTEYAVMQAELVLELSKYGE